MIILWKDIEHSEAMVWYDDDTKTSLVTGHVAELAKKKWEDLKGDIYLYEMQYNPTMYGPWPESQDSLETPLEPSLFSSYRMTILDTKDI